MSGKPDWLKKRMPNLQAMTMMENRLNKLALNTVCRQACCPNSGECFDNGVATFLILGDVCTRNCSFCAVRAGQPKPVDPGEPLRLATAVAALSLKHVVITSVTRDDLPDGGASQYAAVVKTLRRVLPGTTVELLVPDFQGSRGALDTVLQEPPEVLAHNLETVPRLYHVVRPKASYRRSLDLLRRAKEAAPALITKAGLMVGLGESKKEVFAVLRNLREAGCDMLTLGQYLRPGPEQLPVIAYISPETFNIYRDYALSLNFKFVAAGPYVRSSYRAGEAFVHVQQGKKLRRLTL